MLSHNVPSTARISDSAQNEIIKLLGTRQIFPPQASMPAQRVLLEYVSANPHTPLLLRHARGAAIGDALSALLNRAGNVVEREYYVNDSPGSRTLSEFVRDVVQTGQGMSASSPFAAAIAARLPKPYTAPNPDDVSRVVVEAALSEHRARLESFGTQFDSWFAETSLYEKPSGVAETVQHLRESRFTYESDGALWLRSTAYGDSQDRVLVRADTRDTYLAADLSYHSGKFARNYDRMIDIWDADHEGYVARTYAGLKALNQPVERLEILLCGGVRTVRDGAESTPGEMTMEEAVGRIGALPLRLALLRAEPADAVTLDFAALRRASANAVHTILSALAHARDSEPQMDGELPDIPWDAPAQAIAQSLSALPQAAQTALSRLSPYHLLRGLENAAATFSAQEKLLPADSPLRVPLASAVYFALTDGLTLLAADSVPLETA